MALAEEAIALLEEAGQAARAAINAEMVAIQKLVAESEAAAAAVVEVLSPPVPAEMPAEAAVDSAQPGPEPETVAAEPKKN